MTIKEHYKAILEKKLTEAANLDEMAVTGRLMKKQMRQINRLNRISDGAKTQKGRDAAFNQMTRRENALGKLLKSPKIYDLVSRGGEQIIGTVGKLAGKRPAGEITGAAMFGTTPQRKVPKDVLASAKDAVKTHGLIYTGRDWKDDWLHPLAQVAAVGGRRGPTDAFIRPAKITSRYRD